MLACGTHVVRESLADKVRVMYAEDVTGFKSFLAFVSWLEADRRDSLAKEAVNPHHPMALATNDWENTTIEDFLDAAVAWATDQARAERAEPSESWRYFAQFLFAGKGYE